MIHCWVNHRLSKAGAAAATQSAEDDDAVCERTSSAGIVAALVRYPGLKLQAALASTSFKTDQKEDWMFAFCLPAADEKATDQEEVPDASMHSVLSTENPGKLHGKEDANFHKETVEASISSPSSNAAAEGIVENRKIPLCRHVPSSDAVSSAASGDSYSQMLSSDMVSAIKNVVRNAVDSLHEDHNWRDSMDFIADDLLRELERAAAQVADMEVEMRFLKERVKESETRGQHLEQTLAKVLEKRPITDAGEADSPTSSVQLHCCRGHNCAVKAVQDATQRRLAFLEDICRQKDMTIVELEHQINTLQSKISKMLNAKEEQQRMGVPVTIKELLVKIGSTETSRHSQAADSSDNLSSESTARKRSGGRKVHAVKKSGHSRHCESVLVDMTPNALIDRRRAAGSVQGSNPAKENSYRM